MEYATKEDFSDAKPCGEGETTGLRAGDYFVRYAETATTEAGAVSKWTIDDGPEPVILNYDETKDQLAQELNAEDKTPEQKVEDIKGLSEDNKENLAEVMRADDGLVEQLAQIEEQYAEDKGIRSEVAVDEELSDILNADSVSMVGGALNAGEGENITLSVSKTEEEEKKEVNEELYEEGLQLEIKLVIRHYQEDGTAEVVNWQDNGDGITVNEDVTAKATWKDAVVSDTSLRFSTVALTLEDNLAMRFVVKKATLTNCGVTEPYCVFEFNGATATVTESVDYGDRLAFIIRNIAPQQMNDTIFATLYGTRGNADDTGLPRQPERGGRDGSGPEGKLEGRGTLP